MCDMRRWRTNSLPLTTFFLFPPQIRLSVAIMLQAVGMAVFTCMYATHQHQQTVRPDTLGVLARWPLLQSTAVHASLLVACCCFEYCCRYALLLSSICGRGTGVMT